MPVIDHHSFNHELIFFLYWNRFYLPVTGNLQRIWKARFPSTTMPVINIANIYDPNARQWRYSRSPARPLMCFGKHNEQGDTGHFRQSQYKLFIRTCCLDKRLISRLPKMSVSPCSLCFPKHSKAGRAGLREYRHCRAFRVVNIGNIYTGIVVKESAPSYAL